MKFDFLICSERSGSNLITKLLDNHSKYCGPTPPHLLRVFEPVMSKYGDLNNYENWNAFINYIYEFFNCKIGVWTSHFTKDELLLVKTRTLAGVVKFIYHKEAKNNNKENVFIKEVRTYNFLPFIKDNFNSSKFIWLVRDPRDMALSWSKSPVHRGDIVRASKIWREDQQKTIKLHEKLKYTPTFLLVKYEDLITNQKEVLNSVCDFLYIDFEMNMIEFHRNKMSIANAGKTDNWKNLKKEIIVNNSKKYLENLSKEQIQYIEYICQKEMDYFGYEKEYELLKENDFNVINDKLFLQERNEKPEYQLISEEERLKREKWYSKFLEIQEQ